MCREGGIQTVLKQLGQKIESNTQLSAACNTRSSTENLEQLIVSCLGKLRILAEKQDIAEE